MLGPVLGAAIVSLVGVWAYFKQKECETNRRVYLEGGLEQLANQYEYALGVFRHNWTRAIFVLRQIRDLGPKADPSACNSSFLRLEPQHFQIGTHHRVQRLVQDMVFWDVQQILVPFVEATADFFASDLCVALRWLSKGEKLAKTHEEVHLLYWPRVVSLEKESQSFYQFLAALQDLTRILERQKFTSKSIDEFHRIAEVRAIVAKVKAAHQALPRRSEQEVPRTLASTLT